MAEIYRWAPQVLSIDSGEELVLMDLVLGKYFGLRGAIRHVSALLESGASRGDLASTICAHCDVSLEDAQGDLDGILSQLSAMGLIETSQAGASN
jgi:hypothetical protein